MHVSTASFGSALPTDEESLFSAPKQMDKGTMSVCASLASEEGVAALVVDGNGRLLTPSSASRSKLSDSLLQVNGASKLHRKEIEKEGERGRERNGWAFPLFE